MLLMERTLLTRFFVLFSNPGVSPRGAWSRPSRRMLINFGLLLQSWAEWQLASVTPLSSDCLILLSPYLEDPLCPASFSGVGTRGSRRALHPPAPHPKLVLSSRRPFISESPLLRVPNRKRPARLLPSFAGYTLEPVTASLIPKRNEKRKK